MIYIQSPAFCSFILFLHFFSFFDLLRFIPVFSETCTVFCARGAIDLLLLITFI